MSDPGCVPIHSSFYGNRTVRRLRDRARRYREMSAEGDDVCLRAALLELAEEFEREAARLAAVPDHSNLKSQGAVGNG